MNEVTKTFFKFFVQREFGAKETILRKCYLLKSGYVIVEEHNGKMTTYKKIDPKTFSSLELED